jgi:predicted O-methyltransferase YrrM
MTSSGADSERDRLYLVLGGHIFFQTLSAAVQLGLFPLLSREGPLGPLEIAKSLGIGEKPARVLLLGCTALGLLRKDQDGYRNSPAAENLLIPGVSGNVVSIVLWQHFINYRPMYHFVDSLRQGRNVGLDLLPGEEPTLYGRLAHSPELERVFQDAMEAISAQANATLTAAADLAGVERVVDVGGGNGTNVIALARKYPHLRATVFDSAAVCEIARRNFEAVGLADRLEAVAGDCFKDPLPSADCFLLAHFCTIWSEEKNLALLGRCHEALSPGGRVLIFNMMQHDDGTGPLLAALGSPYFLTLATGEGMLYTWGEYEAWLKEAGFEAVERQALPSDHGLITGVKGRAPGRERKEAVPEKPRRPCSPTRDRS